MKAAPFAYHRPDSVDEAVDELAGGDAKVLAGGQSLVPVLAMRLGRPGDARRHHPAAGAGRPGGRRAGSCGSARPCASARWSGPTPRGRCPLIGRAMPFVGHRELRSRGTVCGSLAHADPAAELPAVAACLDATVVLRGPRGTREVPARELVVGAMTTAAGPDELHHRGALPGGARPGTGSASPRSRDGTATSRWPGWPCTCARGGGATLAAFGVSDRPVIRDVTALLGADPTEAGLRAVDRRPGRRDRRHRRRLPRLARLPGPPARACSPPGNWSAPYRGGARMRVEAGRRPST